MFKGLRNIHGCDLPKTEEESFAVKIKMHEACGFAYTIVRSDVEIFGPVNTEEKTQFTCFCNVF